MLKRIARFFMLFGMLMDIIWRAIKIAVKGSRETEQCTHQRKI